MDKQIIISIGREFGSRGHVVGQMLAEKLGIQYVDRNMLEDIAEEKDIDQDLLHALDEKKPKVFLSRTVRGYSNAPEDAVAQMQFEYLLEKAEAGESFVVIGRCADYVLRENPNLVTVFITASEEEKIQNVMSKRKVERKEAKQIMKRHDKNRKTYYSQHTPYKWGSASHYDLLINSSKLGLEGTARLIETYIQEKTKHISE
ncbi:MAG: cytidylate kinase-like family protein [Eubacterium sp.]|nr:cytidylate kinase-like family protein [Eubacterium sp.]